jgi:hypothetical protein
MLRYIKDLPEHVIGIHAVGEVSKEDYEKVFIPRLEELVARQGEINYLLILETDIGNFTAGAWWDDFTVGLKHFKQWSKVAIVTDQKAVEWLSDVFTAFIPGKSKGFPMAQLDAAIKWVSEKEPGEKTQTKLPSDNDQLEPELETSSNKGQGPAGENL